MCEEDQIPFQEGDWLIDRNNPAQPGQFTGRARRAGPFIMIELRFLDGNTVSRPLNTLEPMPQSQGGPLDRMLKGHFGTARDLRRVITYEKLKGTLHEVIYSMEAAQIDFYPYQFKPVMKLISAPTERLILADEVGLGKTIEAALIWLELQARRQAKRLLVICPNSLAEKWRKELRHKFLIDARVVRFRELRAELRELRDVGSSHAFALIGTYTGLRPPKSELRLLRRPVGEGDTGSPKTEFCRGLKQGEWEDEPFDLVIFDEAHYMRNPATSTFALGDALSESAVAVLCVSATPVNNSNVDLHSLLKLIDRSFFESQVMFEELLHANRPAVHAGNALARIPVEQSLLATAVEEMGRSAFIRESPMFSRFAEAVRKLDPQDKAELARCQDMAEKLNVLGQYVNRTRRVQVKEHRPVRDPLVLTVEYTPEERCLYDAILHFVRERCERDSRAFHVFQLLQLQLRAASCLPVVARELREEHLSQDMELLEEAVGEETLDELFDFDLSYEQSRPNLDDVLEYDFETNDTKYEELRRMLLQQVTDEKVIIFAYYRGTLAYLFRRLREDGVTATVIHGGIDPETRDREMDRFADPRGPRVLLSSEVGSEGIDLQFCRVVVNYDLPWNPMRVEQRIGRIDRVGQKADRLSIVNFKVTATVEERLYMRLHEKLMRFTNSLGDLEAVIGKEVQSLTVDLLSKRLTPEQEEERMEKTELAIETQLLHLQELEESGDAFLALSDYLQRRIDEVRDRGRYMLPEELEDYVIDFFQREFRGCEVNENTPKQGCMRIRLTADAHASLRNFMQNDTSLSARPFRQKAFTITFRRDIGQALTPRERQTIHFTNHLSPLIRWITKVNKDRSHSLLNVSAVTLRTNTLPTGTYCYCIERWTMKALSSHEVLAHSVVRIDDRTLLDADLSEQVIQLLLHDGERWDGAQCEEGRLRNVYECLEENLGNRFGSALEDFVVENATASQIREQRVKSFFERRIEQDKRRLQTLRQTNPESRVLRATEGRLRKAIENRDDKLREIRQRSEPEVEKSTVAAGIFRVV